MPWFITPCSSCDEDGGELVPRGRAGPEGPEKDRDLAGMGGRGTQEQESWLSEIPQAGSCDIAGDSLCNCSAWGLVS